jgi:hypothetical protein
LQLLVHNAMNYQNNPWMNHLIPITGFRRVNDWRWGRMISCLGKRITNFLVNWPKMFLIPFHQIINYNPKHFYNSSHCAPPILYVDQMIFSLHFIIIYWNVCTNYL